MFKNAQVSDKHVSAYLIPDMVIIITKIVSDCLYVIHMLMILTGYAGICLSNKKST